MAQDDWNDDLEEWEEDDHDADSADDLLVCPACRRPVHEDTQQCPNCGDWITPVYPESRSKRWFVMAIVAFLILCMILLAVLR